MRYISQQPRSPGRAEPVPDGQQGRSQTPDACLRLQHPHGLPDEEGATGASLSP